VRTRGTRLWAIILAAGAGSRLLALTRALHGQATAKQFAVVVGGSSLVQTTVERILPLLPEERIMVVVGPGQEASARAQLARWPGIEVVAQPRDLDTGPGLLLPLAMVRARDRGARVVVLPADHHVVRPDGLLDAIERAMAASVLYADELCLLGSVPDAPDSDCDWIVPGASLHLFGLHAVSSIVEKASLAQAARLQSLGAVLSTCAMVASVERFWALGRAHLSQHAAAIESCVTPRSPPHVEAQCLDEAYASLWPASFGRAILQPGALSVLPLSGAGWSDWDTPGQVFRSLKGTADLSPLLARLGGAEIRA
jgi:mannose-1-phosphate guanylyltransferase